MECWRAAWCWCCAVLALLTPAAAGPRYSSRIVHTHAGAIRGIIVEPAPRRLEPVEAFLGVPYAGPPARLAPPPPARPWPGTRLADAQAPACPQRAPDVSNRTAALAAMPLAVYRELLAVLPLLANQSEDCLHLNLYVPGSGARGVEAPYAVVVWLGASAHEWGAAAALDGAVLAARAHVLVVTINYRLGLLGFLSSGARGDAGSAAGGAGVLDAAAALRWVRTNVAAFGGDPRRVTLAASRAGAALVGALLALPDARGLASRVLLLSGSPLSPTALAPDAALAREHVAQALRCARDPATPGEHWLSSCVRSRPLPALLAVPAPRARFLAGWAPSPAAPRDLLASDAFLECALAVVLATTESYSYFSEDDIRRGFEEEHRNRVLRTYVRNVYRWHRNEIFAAIRNEYTDWEKPIQHPINIRDATLEALSDGAGAAPALRLLQLHARRGAPSYLAHFAHQPRDPDYPQRLGSVSGDTLPFFLGMPLGAGASERNYSRADAAVSDAAVSLLASFAKTGAPAPRHAREPALTWPRYEMSTQLYLSLSSKPRVRSHYRGHKLALWLHLVPQLHRPSAPPRHHQFRAGHADSFAGEIFPELYSTVVAPDAGGPEDAGEGEEEDAEEEDSVVGEGCSPSPALAPPSPRPALPALPAPDRARDALDDHYYSYTVALGVTVGAGCFLLALNVLVFAGIYLQRGRARRRLARERRRHKAEGVERATEGGRGTSPPRSTLKRSIEAELKERPPAPAQQHKKRVQIQEISV